MTTEINTAAELWIMETASDHFEKHGAEYVKLYIKAATAPNSPLERTEILPELVTECAWLHSKCWAEKMYEIQKQRLQLIEQCPHPSTIITNGGLKCAVCQKQMK